MLQDLIYELARPVDIIMIFFLLDLRLLKSVKQYGQEVVPVTFVDR